jgi:hypothetical protein
MTIEQFESLRCWAVVFVVFQRLFLMPIFIQAYLNMAQERLIQQKKEAGRITNKDLQKQVKFVYTPIYFLF